MTADADFELWSMTASGMVLGEHLGAAIVRTHHISKCAGQTCALHNPSDHPLRDAPLHWRGDRRLMERICAHGIGHPDPDAIAYGLSVGGTDTGAHGCDGCCATTNIVVTFGAPESDPDDQTLSELQAQTHFTMLEVTPGRGGRIEEMVFDEAATHLQLTHLQLTVGDLTPRHFGRRIEIPDLHQPGTDFDDPKVTVTGLLRGLSSAHGTRGVWVTFSPSSPSALNRPLPIDHPVRVIGDPQ